MSEVEKKDHSKLVSIIVVAAVAVSVGLTHLGVADVSKHVEEACVTHAQISELVGALQGSAAPQEVEIPEVAPAEEAEEAEEVAE
jgi:hypothetical protein